MCVVAGEVEDGLTLFHYRYREPLLRRSLSRVDFIDWLCDAGYLHGFEMVSNLVTSSSSQIANAVIAWLNFFLFSYFLSAFNSFREFGKPFGEIGFKI